VKGGLFSSLFLSLSFYLGARVKHILSSVWTGEKRQAGALSSPFFLSRSDAGRLLLLKTTQTQLVVLFSSNKGEQVTRYFMMIELKFDKLILHFIAASCGEYVQKKLKWIHTQAFHIFCQAQIYSELFLCIFRIVKFYLIGKSNLNYVQHFCSSFLQELNVVIIITFSRITNFYSRYGCIN
jgi:hypothetical protein